VIPFSARKRVFLGERGSYIQIEDAGQRIIFHHFNGNFFLGLFGLLWLTGWMAGLVICARETQSPWTFRDYGIVLGMSVIWLLMAVVILAEFVRHDQLIFDRDAIRSTVRVLFVVRNREITLTEVADLRLEESRRRGVIYSIVIDRRGQKIRRWVEFGKHLHPGVLLQMISLMIPILEHRSVDIGPNLGEEL
jgi:hypothetical protein